MDNPYIQAASTCNTIQIAVQDVKTHKANIRGDAFLKITMGSSATGPSFYLVNEGSGTLSIRSGTTLLGFGKVTWRKVEETEEPNLHKELPVRFTDSSGHLRFHHLPL